jgi:hypothetical protein
VVSGQLPVISCKRAKHGEQRRMITNEWLLTTDH